MSRRLWLGLGFLILARLAAFYLIPLCAEDAYITFHASLDPAWHRATTSPLWSLLCALGDPPTVARLLSLIADCAALWAASCVLPTLGFWAFLAIWVSPFFTGSAVSGLETHIVACAMILSRALPWGYLVAAAMRPDAAVLALCSSGRRWRWAVAGTVLLGLAGLWFAHGLLPHTMLSKAIVYGVHPGAWGWLHPEGFGWMTLFLVPACLTKRWLHVAAALAFLLTLVALGLPAFWWWAVPPLTMLGFAACERITKARHLIAALIVIAYFWGGQSETLHTRVMQEGNLWKLGRVLAAANPKGTIMLEPAGMIPYQNPQLKVIDDVGLIDPWMAYRRAAGPGWRTDALERYKPEWLMLRLREYAAPEIWSVGNTLPYRSKAEARVPGYAVVYSPGVKSLGNKRVSISLKSSSLIILARR